MTLLFPMLLVTFAFRFSPPLFLPAGFNTPRSTENTTTQQDGPQQEASGSVGANDDPGRTALQVEWLPFVGPRAVFFLDLLLYFCDILLSFFIALLFFCTTSCVFRRLLDDFRSFDLFLSFSDTMETTHRFRRCMICTCIS